MECMVKVVKPFYAIKCIVGWLAGIYYVLGVKVCWIQDLCSVNIKWSFARPIRANGAHPSTPCN